MHNSEHSWTGGDNLQREAVVKVHGLTDKQATVFVRLLWKNDLPKPADLAELLDQAGDDVDDNARILADWIKKNPKFVSENS